MNSVIYTTHLILINLGECDVSAAWMLKHVQVLFSGAVIT